VRILTDADSAAAKDFVLERLLGIVGVLLVLVIDEGKRVLIGSW